MTPDKELLNAYNNGGIKEAKSFLARENIDVNTKDSCGITPLHNAARLGNLDVARLLLQQ